MSSVGNLKKDLHNERFQNFNFKEIVRLNIKMLEFFGIIVLRSNKTQLITSLLRIVFFVVFGFGTFFISSIIYLCLQTNNITNLTSALVYSLTYVMVGVKFYYIHKYQPQLLTLLERINRKEFKPKSDEQCKILNNYIKQSIVTSKMFWYSCVASCTFCGVCPFTEEQLSLPLEGWFPFDTEKSPNFQIVYVYQLFCQTVIGLSDISIDTLMSGLLMVLCAQLDMLCNSLKDIRNDPDTVTYSEEVQCDMDRKLVECVIHHRCILEFASEYSSIFPSVMFRQFIISVVIIGTTLFKISMTPIASLETFALALYLFCILLEMFLWCYYGNEVAVQSSKLLQSIYECSWEKCSKKFQRNMLYMMTRYQKELHIYAGGVFLLSLDTFLKIVKTSWSYFTVLLQVNSKDK